MRLFAALNDEVFYLSQTWYGYDMVMDDKSWTSVVSDKLTEVVTKHPRFIKAIGTEEALRTKVEVKSERFAGEHMNIVVGVIVDDEETDFHYSYGQPDEEPPLVAFSDQTTRLMRAIRFLNRACTDAKTLKRRSNPNTKKEETLEVVFEKILEEGDIKVYF